MSDAVTRLNAALDREITAYFRVASLEELKGKESLVIHIEEHTITLFYHQDRVFAVDNRCPHMGFPLDRGSVYDGMPLSEPVGRGQILASPASAYHCPLLANSANCVIGTGFPWIPTMVVTSSYKRCKFR